MQDEQQVVLRTDGALATLTLVRPPHNLWTETALSQLNAHVLALSRDSQCRCLIVTGASGNEASEPWFSKGLDRAALEAGDPLTGSNLSRQFAQVFGGLRRFPGITIAAINGHAHDEGVSWALSCDFRLCADSANFQFTAGSAGLLPLGGSTQLLPRLVGESRAKRMILGEEVVDARQALDIGLVDEVFAPGLAEAQAHRWATKLLQQSPAAMRAAKQLIEHARMRPLETGFAAERDWQAQIIDSGDHLEARRAKAEHREPKWPNN